jgi:signal transduction histidine kinase
MVIGKLSRSTGVVKRGPNKRLTPHNHIHAVYSHRAPPFKTVSGLGVARKHSMVSLKTFFNISQRIVPIPSISVETSMYDAFNYFRSNPEYNLFPIVNNNRRPRGILRERSLKEYTYGVFGRELVKRRNLEEFITPCTTVNIALPAEDVISIFAANANPDGLIVVDGAGCYCGVLLSGTLLEIYEENRLVINRQLVHTQKMEAIGTLAGGIAHDFNNILMPIMGFSELLHHTLPEDDEKSRHFLSQIQQASKRARDLVSQILTFSRQREQERSYFKLSAIVKETLKLLRASLPSTIAIDHDVQTATDTIYADPTQIHQVLMNLCTNASYAMRTKGGRLMVTIRDYDGVISGWSQSPEPPQGNVLQLSVADTGNGIDSHILHRIFDPFYTTKPQGEGTGMGLAVVHGIVKSYGGVISVETALGSGTTFHIYLPRQNAPTGTSAPAENCQEIQGNNQLILIVDDERMITDLAEEMLPHLGFRVKTCTSSLEALICFSEAPAQFDAVVTDLTMPDLTGLELARKLLEIRPDLPIVLCTGYAEKMSADSAQIFGLREILLKPLDYRQLARVLNGIFLSVP